MVEKEVEQQKSLEKSKQRFDKEEFVRHEVFGYSLDLAKAILEEGTSYTKEEAQKKLDGYLSRKIG